MFIPNKKNKRPIDVEQERSSNRQIDRLEQRIFFNQKIERNFGEQTEIRQIFWIFFGNFLKKTFQSRAEIQFDADRNARKAKTDESFRCWKFGEFEQIFLQFGQIERKSSMERKRNVFFRFSNFEAKQIDEKILFVCLSLVLRQRIFFLFSRLANRSRTKFTNFQTIFFFLHLESNFFNSL